MFWIDEYFQPYRKLRQTLSDTTSADLVDEC